MSDTIVIGGLALRFLQSKETTGGSLDVFEMVVQPNARMPVPHYHRDWDETIIGVSGTSVWRVDGADVSVRPSQSLFIPRGVVHGFRNDTQEPAACLCILTPGALGPDYFREMATLTLGGAPDIAMMQQTMARYGLIPVPAA